MTDARKLLLILPLSPTVEKVAAFFTEDGIESRRPNAAAFS